LIPPLTQKSDFKYFFSSNIFFFSPSLSIPPNGVACFEMPVFETPLAPQLLFSKIYSDFRTKNNFLIIIPAITLKNILYFFNE